MPWKFHFGFLKEPFSELFLKEPSFFLGMKNILIIQKTYCHYKESFVQWKGSMVGKGSSFFFLSFFLESVSYFKHHCCLFR